MQPGLCVDTCQPLNMSHPLNRGLVSRWQNLPLGQWGRGTTFRDLNRASVNDGTLNGALAWAGSAGRRGGHGRLSGFAGGATTSTYVDCGSSASLNPTGGLTLACWIYPTAFASANGESWCIGRDDNVLGRSYSFGFGTATASWFQINGSGSTFTGTATPSNWLTANEWNWLCATASSAGGAYYTASPTSGLVNRGATTWATPNTTTGSTCLGRRTFAANQDGMVGSMDAAVIYNRALSASEVAALYAEELAGCPEILRWVRPAKRWSTQVPAAATGGLLLRRRRAMLAGGLA